MEQAGIEIGIQPINWSNDDFFELGADTPLEECLAQMQEASYAGSELGHKFPKDKEKLEAILATYNLKLISGWHSTYLLSNVFEKELQAFVEHTEFLKSLGSEVVILAECTNRTYNAPETSLESTACMKPLSDKDWGELGHKLDALAKVALGTGMKTAYHPHMGTVVQSQAQIDRLMGVTTQLGLLIDTGHLAFAGADFMEVLRRHKDRVTHFHLKNIRPGVLNEVQRKKMSFKQAVVEGVFTVPGDKGIDYRPLFEEIQTMNYRGWLVVEAEQDPKKYNPLAHAKLARRYIRELTNL